MKYLLPSLVILLFSCVPITPNTTAFDKTLEMADQNYEDYVGMVQLTPYSSSGNNELDYPVIAVGSSGVKLTFDLLEQNTTYLNVRYIHCNMDWTPSSLPAIQFLDVYNELSITDYNYSANTAIPYVNYSIHLPAPTRSGNYLIVVYRDSNKDDILFSRRLIVYEQKTSINTLVRASNNISKRQQNQQLEFEITYYGIEHPNPLREFNVVILQNHNWNMMISGLKPTLIREDQNYLEYHHFNQENNFAGFNEFRFFDLRAMDYRGINVASIQKQPQHIEVYLGRDKPKSSLAYSQLNKDLNGGYFLENTDPNDSDLQSEYAYVHFELQADQYNGQVNLTGRYNNWHNTPMQYDETTGTYKGLELLKQGYYDYCYLLESTETPFYEIEGSHFQARNDYEILFYYRNPYNNYDEVIGYKLFSSY